LRGLRAARLSEIVALTLIRLKRSFWFDTHIVQHE
jgi:hypothetical protein